MWPQQGLSLVLVFLINFSSCENEIINNEHQKDNVTIEYSDEHQVGTSGIHYLDLLSDDEVTASTREDDGPVGPVGPVGPTQCWEENCDAAISAMAATLQAAANRICQEVWGEVVCCMDGFITYALMYATPQTPACYPVSDK